MIRHNYPSEICDYCVCTDYGTQDVGTGLHNLCEGSGCIDARGKHPAAASGLCEAQIFLFRNSLRRL